MLNIALRKKIASPTIRLLYDSGLFIQEPAFNNELKAQIKRIRAGIKPKNEDRLELKLKQLGNKGGWYRTKCEELLKALYQHKGVPNDGLGSWRSIEFELIFKSQAAAKEFAHLVRYSGLGKHTTIKTDGSLRCNDNDTKGNPAEVVLSYKAGNEQAVYEFCKLLKGRAYVNDTCGTHVHFDMRNATPEQAINLGNRLARCVPALRLLLPRSRRANQFCSTSINQIGGGGPRYSFVNMHAFNKYKTIEVRGHSGTILAEKIVNWIKICEKIMTTENMISEAKAADINEFINHYGFDENLANYIKARAEHFGTPVGTNENEAVVQEPVDVPPLPHLMNNAANNPPTPAPIPGVGPVAAVRPE